MPLTLVFALLGVIVPCYSSEVMLHVSLPIIGREIRKLASCPHGSPLKDSDAVPILCGADTKVLCDRGYYCAHSDFGNICCRSFYSTIKIMSICGAPPMVGPCTQKISKWYFDDQTKICKHFFYGGCRGNINKFPTEDYCYRVCGDRCTMAQDSGEGSGTARRYYFNRNTQTCDKFIYHGALGNANNFRSLKTCYSICEPHPCKITTCPFGSTCSEVNIWCRKEPCLPLAVCNKDNICNLPRDEANDCAPQKRRYTYNQPTGTCKPFKYGGCEGNANRFLTSNDCMDACIKDGFCPEVNEIIRPEAHCNSVTRDQCITDPDCHDTHKCCTGTCGFKECIAPLDRPTKCELPADPGTCDDSETRYFFDTTTETCEKLTYTGCGGNANRFKNKMTCMNNCPAFPCRAHPCDAKVKCEEHVMTFCKKRPCPRGAACNPSNKCNFPRDKGPCKGNNTIRYFHSTKGRKCYKFPYSNCAGSPNNFVSLQACEEHCVKHGKCSKDLRPASICHEFQGKNQCASDPDCPGNFKCCGNRCDVTECLPVDKPGKCPVDRVDQICVDPHDNCDFDNDCNYEKKCCHTHCGRRCLDRKMVHW